MNAAPNRKALQPTKSSAFQNQQPDSTREAIFLIARLALAGHVVHKGQRGDFTVCKYGYSYYAQDFDALQAFTRKLGVTHG